LKKVFLSFLFFGIIFNSYNFVQAEDDFQKTITDEKEIEDGISLNGINQYGIADVNINPLENPNLTIEAWVNPKKINDYYKRSQIVSHDNGGYDRSLLIEKDWTGKSYWTIFTGDDAWKPVEIDENKWQHVAVVYTPDNIYFYKNGVKYEYGKNPTNGDGKNYVNIGKNPDYGEYFNGAITNLRIWSKALESSQLNSSILGPVGRLIGYWKLDENVGYIAKDYSPFNHDINFEEKPKWYYENYEKSKKQSIQYNTSEGEIVARTGDVDNLGFGFSDDSYDPISSTSIYNSYHSFPWDIDDSDPEGTDRIMVPSGVGYYLPGDPLEYNNNKFRDGYTKDTKRPNNEIQEIKLNFPLQNICEDENGQEKEICADNAELQLYVDDFQPIAEKSKFKVTIDGKRFYEMEDIINHLDLTGPKGQLLRAAIPSNLLKELNDSEIKIKIDDETTGIGDGYAIDFARIIINPKEDYTKDIVFIPGIMGTELYEIENDGSKDTLWIPEDEDVFEIKKLFLTKEGKVPTDSNVKIGEPLDKYYGKIIRKLRMAGYRVHTFGYDWRLDNNYNANQLEKFINGEKIDKFSILAHSMGGLIATKFIQKEENFNKVDKMITAGTPYLGSPKSLWTLETGEILEPSLSQAVVADAFKKLSSTSDSTYQLLPSFRYFDNISSSYYITIQKQLLSQGKITTTNLTEFNDTKDFINKQDLSEPGGELSDNTFLSEADEFHKNLNLSKIINSDKVFTFASSGKNTLSNILYTFDENDNLIGKDMEKYLMGDGTVPLKSATINGMLNGKNNFIYEDIGHSSLYNNEEIIDKVEKILRDKNEISSNYSLLKSDLNSSESWTKLTFEETKPEDIEIINSQEIEEKGGTIDIYKNEDNTIINFSGDTLKFNVKRQINLKTQFKNKKNKIVKEEKIKKLNKGVFELNQVKEILIKK